jgi:hypothetical protein
MHCKINTVFIAPLEIDTYYMLLEYCSSLSPRSMIFYILSTNIIRIIVSYVSFRSLRLSCRFVLLLWRLKIFITYIIIHTNTHTHTHTNLKRFTRILCFMIVLKFDLSFHSNGSTYASCRQAVRQKLAYTTVERVVCVRSL